MGSSLDIPVMLRRRLNILSGVSSNVGIRLLILRALGVSIGLEKE